MYIFHMYEEKTIVPNPSIYLHISNIYIVVRSTRYTPRPRESALVAKENQQRLEWSGSRCSKRGERLTNSRVTFVPVGNKDFYTFTLCLS